MLRFETRRRRFPAHLARYRRIDRVRIGVMIGLVPATAAVFLANRLVGDEAHRAVLEQGAFAGA